MGVHLPQRVRQPDIRYALRGVYLPPSLPPSPQEGLTSVDRYVMTHHRVWVFIGCLA